MAMGSGPLVVIVGGAINGRGVTSTGTQLPWLSATAGKIAEAVPDGRFFSLADDSTMCRLRCSCRRWRRSIYSEEE